jgi:hypothetical protein
LAVRATHDIGGLSIGKRASKLWEEERERRGRRGVTIGVHRLGENRPGPDGEVCPSQHGIYCADADVQSNQSEPRTETVGEIKDRSLSCDVGLIELGSDICTAHIGVGRRSEQDASLPRVLHQAEHRKREHSVAEVESLQTQRRIRRPQSEIGGVSGEGHRAAEYHATGVVDKNINSPTRRLTNRLNKRAD